MAIKLQAPRNKFRVICVDTFDGGDWIEGDFDTKEQALECARKKGGEMLKTHVYDDNGNHVGEAGTF
jgi:hypothetical protein